MTSSGYKFNASWKQVSLDNEPGEIHRLMMQNSPESYFTAYKGRPRLAYSTPSKNPSPILPCFQPSSPTVVHGPSQPSLSCCTSAKPVSSDDNSPASAFQIDSDNDESYGAVRVGGQKRKAGQMSADSSASDLSVVFSPRKKAKSKTKIEGLADELEPYRQILGNLKKDNEKKYQKQIKQLIQNLRDKEFLQSSVVDIMVGEAVQCCPPVVEQFVAVAARVGSIAVNSFDKQSSKEILLALQSFTKQFNI
ncbi:hypothetical protein F5887DRAFT_1086012 [Amanita rubescens]|nr:hypothetical protein F5887DRAFT_1086012 [Amanita rubescens]